MQTDVRIGNADIGTLTCLFAELVDNGILYLISYKLRMAELLGKDNGVDGKGLVDSDVFAPVNVLDTFIDIVSRESLKMLDGFQNTDGGVQLEIGTI